MKKCQCLSRWHSHSLRVYYFRQYLNHKLKVDFLDSVEVLLFSEVELVLALAAEAVVAAACSVLDNPHRTALQITSTAKKQTQIFSE